MKAKLFLLPFAFFTMLTFSTITTSWATVITFDDLSETASGSFIANGYQGLNWSEILAFNAILHTNLPVVIGGGVSGFYYGMVSASNAISIGGYGPAEIDTFTNLNFRSAYLTGAWRSNLNVQVQGFRGGSLLYDTIVVASATNPTLFTFNYLDIDRLSFNTSGGEAAFEHDGGAIVVLDNLSFEFVPEPSSFLLTTVAALMLWPLLRRKRA